MIYSSSHALSPDMVVKIEGVFIDYTSISAFDIELTEDEHDFATIIINGIPPESVTDFFNKPVYLRIDSGIGRVQEFQGYVVAVEPVSVTKMGMVNSSFIQTFRIRCLGASYVMKSVSSRVWEYPTLHNILSDLSFKYKFSASYPKDTFKPTRMTQANESDWTFLRRVVEKYGYSMSVHGTHIHVWDVAKATRRLPSYHVLATPKTNYVERPGMILNFEADMGQISLSGNNSEAVNTTLDDRGNIISIAAKDGFLKDTKTVKTSLFDNPIKGNYQNFSEAERAVEAAQRRRNMFTARAEITAGAGIVPGGTVSLIGYGGNFDGIWYVSSVLHKLANSMYTTELVLYKNKLNYEETITGALNVAGAPPEPLLINGKWVSSSGKVDQYA